MDATNTSSANGFLFMEPINLPLTRPTGPISRIITRVGESISNVKVNLEQAFTRRVRVISIIDVVDESSQGNAVFYNSAVPAGENRSGSVARLEEPPVIRPVSIASVESFDLDESDGNDSSSSFVGSAKTNSARSYESDFGFPSSDLDESAGNDSSSPSIDSAKTNSRRSSESDFGFPSSDLDESAGNDSSSPSVDSAKTNSERSFESDFGFPS